RYSPQPLGHYGLAKTNYLHFTSPIRRYADLVVHRALGRDPAGTGGRPARSASASYHPDMAEIASISEHISVTERTAAGEEVDAFKRQVDFAIALASAQPKGTRRTRKSPGIARRA